MSAEHPPAAPKQRAGAVQLTADGHHIIINGRRWRATDPAIPEEVAAILRADLMAARRAVRAALRTGDEHAERSARADVQTAKEALGERGTPWWELSLAQREARWSSVGDGRRWDEVT